ncbi:MAG: single-stranded-DNA-specific exonuclease RecJ, partial [Candidatus Gastranaerophilales bacterium]|nr:single-stranded-DNA-specific exonuclease RecJ [Candidatus Gastranaerophilales bacterium]
MAIPKKWKIKDNTIDDNLLEFCGGSRVLALLLKNRGIDTKEKIINFLNPLKAKFSNPDIFKDMQKSVERIKSAIEKKEHITVYGDFDADGVTSTALLFLTLKKIGADADFYLPDRNIESHGLNTGALVKIISKKKSRLIITVDCGISNSAEVNFAKGFKTDIIITDHHEAPEILPDAFAIINPKAADSVNPALSVEELQSLNYLAGAGVAFKLACKLLEEYNSEDFVYEILPLACVGTIGDVVELLGENRSIAAMGLELIRNGKHKGIQKLLKSSGLEDISAVTSDNIAYTIVPRLNAAGRLEAPDTAINLLVSDNDEELDKTIETLNDLNKLRQELCDETFKNAVMMYSKNASENKKSIVLFNPDWHIGIIGIVASKLVENFNKPVFLMTKDANSSNIIRCSCRSIQNLNIHSVLSQHKDLFLGFGGHKMAAGFSFDENKISFDNFKKILNSTIDEFSQNIDFNSITINADMELSPSDINIETVKIIDKLQPFGAANPSPLFVMNEAVLSNFKMMGQNNNHLKMFISKENIPFECVKWNCPDFNLPTDSNLDLLFSLRLNTFNNNTVVQLMIEDVHSEFIKLKNNCEIKILDHRNKKNILPQVFDYITSTKKMTAIYIENTALATQLKLPDEIQKKVFSKNNIPSDIEQIMFFDIPAIKEDFYKILKEVKPDIIHLMNFNISEIGTDNLIAKLSGMIKYALSNLSGIINLTRAAKALSVTEETVECALAVFEDSKMIDLNKLDENNFKISY